MTDEDITPVEPPRTPTQNAVTRLLQIVEHVDDFKRRVLLRAMELHNGRIPDWKKERDAFEIELSRRWAALEQLVLARLP